MRRRDGPRPFAGVAVVMDGGKTHSQTLRKRRSGCLEELALAKAGDAQRRSSPTTFCPGSGHYSDIVVIYGIAGWVLPFPMRMHIQLLR